MNKLNIFSVKTVAIALTIASLSMSANVQAHHNDEYLSLVPFVLYNVLSQPVHYRSQHQQHTQHHDYYQRPRRHSHSYDRYSDRHGRYSEKRLIKKHRRH